MTLENLINQEMEEICAMSKSQILDKLSINIYQLTTEIQPLINDGTLINFSKKRFLSYFEVSAIILYYKFGLKLERKKVSFANKVDKLCHENHQKNANCLNKNVE
ncbi:hypothetical protein ACE193_15260 [Bernardetia sp. OM2101]|uniref:hypothetical protein n=1 Tax=Bernardetia sp. OM2101 TaxID=3344876 RepID=UPI0035CEB26F